ncbi:MAG: membrane protein insertion efficiency factor YidD [Parcubacteria group bacterium]|nr:membrane protein insertion efficiency factor YidD [Parcubacteria group bacterium]
MRGIILKLIVFYQRWLSPHRFFVKGQELRIEEYFISSSGCRFWPSCSEYAVICFKEKSIYQAFLSVSWRLLRCGPWSSGGVDMPSIQHKNQ